jgi:threonine dehydrogenase-like Zn-dependent dehydrogenase
MSLPETMRAAVLYGERDMRLVEDYPVPQPGPGEILVKVGACAICGTDPKILAHGWPNHPPYGQFIFGHEYAGTVVGLGQGVSKFRTGDRVVVEPHKGCGFCDNCRDGLYNVCLNYGKLESGHRHYGFTANGAYAEYACCHVDAAYLIPDEMSTDVATLMTTAATSLYGIRRIGGIQAGETVVVFGPGPVGLMGVVFARLLGAGTIIITGTRSDRLEMGLSLGADVAINIREQNVVERVWDLTGGIGADVVLECAGTTQSAADAVESTKKNGRIALIGTYSQPATLNVNKIVLWNITVSGSRAEGERSLAYALALLGRQTAIDLSPLVTHVFPLSQIHAAFETAEKRLGGAIKILVKP